MPYSDYRPDLMGQATLTPSGSFEAGSLQSFTLVYAAGAFGVDDTGSIKIGFRFATDFGPVQFTDPRAQGYTTVEMKLNFVRPILPDLGGLACEGLLVHRGGTLATSEGRLFDSKGRLLAHGTETCLIFDAATRAQRAA